MHAAYQWVATQTIGDAETAAQPHNKGGPVEQLPPAAVVVDLVFPYHVCSLALILALALALALALVLVLAVAVALALVLALVLVLVLVLVLEASHRRSGW